MSASADAGQTETDFVMAVLELDDVHIERGDEGICVTRGVPVDDTASYVESDDILQLAFEFGYEVRNAVSDFDDGELRLHLRYGGGEQ